MLNIKIRQGACIDYSLIDATVDEFDKDDSFIPFDVGGEVMNLPTVVDYDEDEMPDEDYEPTILSSGIRKKPFDVGSSPPFSFYQPELDEQDELEHRKAERRARCSWLFNSIEVKSGKWKPQRMYCKQWRECPICFHNRAMALRADLQRVADTLIYATLTEAEAAQFIDAHSKEQYRRIPQQEDGTVVLFTTIQNVEAMPDSSQVVDNWVWRMDDEKALEFWTSIMNSPAGTKLSGNLGKEQMGVLSDKDMHTYNVAAVSGSKTVDGEEKQISQLELEQARDASYVLTSDLDPKTPEELQKALDKRTEVMVRILKSWDFTPIVWHEKARESFSNIDWCSKLEKVLPELKARASILGWPTRVEELAH